MHYQKSSVIYVFNFFDFFDLSIYADVISLDEISLDLIYLQDQFKS